MNRTALESRSPAAADATTAEAKMSKRRAKRIRAKQRDRAAAAAAAAATSSGTAEESAHPGAEAAQGQPATPHATDATTTTNGPPASDHEPAAASSDAARTSGLPPTTPAILPSTGGAADEEMRTASASGTKAEASPSSSSSSHEPAATSSGSAPSTAQPPTTPAILPSTGGAADEVPCAANSGGTKAEAAPPPTATSSHEPGASATTGDVSFGPHGYAALTSLLAASNGTLPNFSFGSTGTTAEQHNITQTDADIAARQLAADCQLYQLVVKRIAGHILTLVHADDPRALHVMQGLKASHHFLWHAVDKYLPFETADKETASLMTSALEGDATASKASTA